MTAAGKPPTELDGDLRELIDRQAVTDLLVRYVLALDSHDWEAVAGCFAPEAVFLHPGGQVEGPGSPAPRRRRMGDRGAGTGLQLAER